MAVSTTTDYNETRATIIRDALLHLRVIDPDEIVPPKIGELMNRQLNRMVKAWQAYGPNLWKKDTGILFLQKDVSKYILSSTSSVYATTDIYRYTTTTQTRVAGSDRLFVSSISGMVVGGYIGVALDDGTRFFAKITSLIAVNNRVDITPVLPAGISTTGIKVVFFNTLVTDPYNIISMNRISVSNGHSIETPLTRLSYQDFFELPDKSSSSQPTMFNYDKQLDESIIRLWPVPSDESYDATFTFEKTIFDFDTADNNPDFNQEWLDAIVLNLAVRSASFFGKNVGQSYANLKVEAQNAFMLANNEDNEAGSIVIEPSTRGRA